MEIKDKFTKQNASKNLNRLFEVKPSVDLYEALTTWVKAYADSMAEGQNFLVESSTNSAQTIWVEPKTDSVDYAKLVKVLGAEQYLLDLAEKRKVAIPVKSRKGYRRIIL